MLCFTQGLELLHILRSFVFIRLKPDFIFDTAQSAPPPLSTAPASIQRAVQRFTGVADPKEKARLLLLAGQELAPFPEEAKIAVNRVMGCTSQVQTQRDQWVAASRCRHACARDAAMHAQGGLCRRHRKAAAAHAHAMSAA